MESFHTYLQQFPHYSAQVYQIALPHLRKRVLQPGEHLLQAGHVSRQIAFIESGLLRLYYLRDGKEVTNCFCKEHSISTSYKSLITQQESDISIQAIETSSLILLSYEALQQLYKEDLFWQQLGRLASENEYIVAENHQRFLSDLTATERYVQVLEQDKELLQRVPLNYLATYLQIAPETLSRIRKKISRT